jgi:REP element-mobilizing transposase RayT
MHKHLPKLDEIWVSTPIFYITTCTSERRQELANDHFHKICVEVWNNAETLYGWVVGRYVVMPDHVHFFCSPRCDDIPLAMFVGKWKEWTAKYATRRHGVRVPLWQPEYFDHLLRTSQSYDEKWDYVQQNPKRAGLLAASDDWPYQGELHELRQD